MFGIDLMRAAVRNLFRVSARAAAFEGTAEGIADALEEITGARPAIPSLPVAKLPAPNGRQRRKRATEAK